MSEKTKKGIHFRSFNKVGGTPPNKDFAVKPKPGFSEDFDAHELQQLKSRNDFIRFFMTLLKEFLSDQSENQQDLSLKIIVIGNVSSSD